MHKVQSITKVNKYKMSFLYKKRGPLSTGIFSRTRLLQKSMAKEDRTYDLLAGKYEKFQAPTRIRTQDLLAGSGDKVLFWQSL